MINMHLPENCELSQEELDYDLLDVVSLQACWRKQCQLHGDDLSSIPLTSTGYMRRELKKRNVKKLKVVYSDEQPIRPLEDMSISCRTHCICPPGAQHKCTERRDIPGSTAFVPAVAGLLIAGEIVKDLSNEVNS